jgi:hypothetical protein
MSPERAVMSPERAVLDEMKQREARRVQQLADAKVAELELINEKLRLAAERRSEKEARQEAERAREAAAINAKISAASRPKGGDAAALYVVVPPARDVANESED